MAIAPSLWLAPLSLNASPLVSIGDNADLFFNGSSSVRWTSNLFRDEVNETSDVIFTVTPGLELNVGRGMANADFSILTSYDLVFYGDNNDLNTGLFHIKALGDYQDSRWDLRGSVSFDEYQTTTGDANRPGELIESEAVRFSLRGEYQFSPKFSLASGASYIDYAYVNGSELDFADYTYLTVPVDVYYEMTPKLDLSLGYVYGLRQVDDSVVRGPGYDTTSHFFNLGARGELLPKLTGFFKVGYRIKDAEGTRDDSGMLGLDGDLTWATTAKLTNTLRFSRDFGVGGEGDATEVTSLNWVSVYSINPYWSANGNLGYSFREYVDGYAGFDREDNQYSVGARASYAPNSYWTFSAGYTFMKNDSNLVGFSYDEHAVDLAATLRY